MDQVEFRELRDKLNSSDKPYVMIYTTDKGWTWRGVDEKDLDVEGKDLEKIEYSEVNPDFYCDPGSLLGFIYIDHNCPAILGYGKRSESDVLVLKNIWNSYQ